MTFRLALSITVRAVLFVSKIFFLLCLCFITTKIFTRGFYFMDLIGYNLKFKKNSPFFDCVKTLATYRDSFPCFYCEIGNYIYGVFFSVSLIDSFILKKFCTDVKRVNFDSLSSVLPDIPFGFNGNFYTNNFDFIDQYYDVYRWSVKDMFINKFYN